MFIVPVYRLFGYLVIASVPSNHTSWNQDHRNRPAPGSSRAFGCFTPRDHVLLRMGCGFGLVEVLPLPVFTPLSVSYCLRAAGKFGASWWPWVASAVWRHEPAAELLV